METIDYDISVHSTPNKGDETLLVKFFIDAVKDEKASLAAGRPIFKDAEWIDIRIPGNRDNIVIRPIRPDDITRFPRHYDAFKKRIGNEESVVGTPLAAWGWPGMTRSRIEELKYFNVRTVENVAGMVDGLGQKIMGFQGMKAAAKEYLAATASRAPLVQMQLKMEALMHKVDEQATTIARLIAEKSGAAAPGPVSIAAGIVGALPEAVSAPAPVKAKAKKAAKKKR
jgi:hypothetical protein